MMTGSSSSSDVTAVVDVSTVDGADGVWPEGSGAYRDDSDRTLVQPSPQNGQRRRHTHTRMNTSTSAH